MLCFTVHGLRKLALCGELLSASERLKPSMVKPRVTPLPSELAQMMRTMPPTGISGIRDLEQKGRHGTTVSNTLRSYNVSWLKSAL